MAQLTFLDMEPAMEAIQYCEEMLHHGYREMLKDIESLEKELAEIGDGTTGSYEQNAGIRAQYKNSDKTGGEVVRRERKRRRLADMKKSIEDFDAAIDSLTIHREQHLVEMLLDGMTVKDAATKMKLGRQRVSEIKSGMVRKMAWFIYDLKKREEDGESAA